MKCLVTKLKAVVNDDSLPVITIVSEETKNIMKSYSRANEDMAYYVQKFFDTIGDIKSKIVILRCPCLSSTINEAIQVDLIDGLPHGLVVSLDNSYDASTRTYGVYRIQNNTLNNGQSQTSLVLNNISGIFVKTNPYNPITLTSGNWNGIGWGYPGYIAGQYNFVEDNTLKARLYSAGLNYTIKTSAQYLVKDSNPAYYQDTISTSGAFAYLVGATVEEYETVFTALVELVDKINECWDNV